MSLENTLKKLNDHPSDDIADFAADAYDLWEDASMHKISQAEYKELLEDLKHKQAILAASADLETKAMLNQALEGLISLASAI